MKYSNDQRCWLINPLSWALNIKKIISNDYNIYWVQFQFKSFCQGLMLSSHFDCSDCNYHLTIIKFLMTSLTKCRISSCYKTCSSILFMKNLLHFQFYRDPSISMGRTSCKSVSFMQKLFKFEYRSSDKITVKTSVLNL